MVGDVDAGKSTILGRLMVDLEQVIPEKLAELEAMSAKRGVAFEYSFLLDSFQLERDQAITLDVSRIWLRTAGRDFVFVDAPGHRELVRNMLSGASEVDTAILVVAADEGITIQTRRHALFLRWFGLTEVVVVINKLDLAEDKEKVFVQRKAEVTEFLGKLGVSPIAIVPIVARDGDNVARRSERMPWWNGPTLMSVLEPLRPKAGAEGGPLRFVVQDVFRRDADRLIAGRIESGKIRVGERLVFWPLQASAVVKEIVQWPDSVEEASADSAVAVLLDERIFVDRGAIASHAGDGPPIGHALQATVVWLGAQPLRVGEALRMRIATREIPVTVQRIDEVIDPETLERAPAEEVIGNQIAVVTLTARELIAGDDEAKGTSLGRFILVRDNAIVAGGHVDQVIGRARSEGATDVIAQISSVKAVERTARNGHTGAILWLTGLPSAGKSTVAMAVQRMLFDRGRHVYVLDGDTLRTTLNVDLGFSDDDRAENVRRTAAVAAVLADAGHVVICALISPFSAERERARAAYPQGFYEIYVSCDLPTAEGRDVKGHYKRARLGEIAHFTGISSPYEVPDSPDFTVDTARQSIAESAANLLEFVEERVGLKEKVRV
jgi:bifunctional enzyme CysN/CysC